MLSQADNEFLTRSGKGTPMGELLRRFWMPALLSEELPERDGPPKKIRILGEDLLAFRDSNGRVGIVEPHCPHRGANLYYGRNEECGLRCAFHGWKFDVDGNCVDLPTSPPKSAYKDTIKLLAYPVREWGDIDLGLHGPARARCPSCRSSRWGWCRRRSRYVSKKWQDCNWVQSLEGAHRHRALLVPARRARPRTRRPSARDLPPHGGDRRPVEARRSHALDTQRSAAQVQRSSATTPGW